MKLAWEKLGTTQRILIGLCVAALIVAVAVVTGAFDVLLNLGPGTL